MRHSPVVGGSSITPFRRGTIAVAGASAPRSIRLWLPLTPLALLLGPLAMIAAPFVVLSRRGRRINPVRAAWSLGGVLLALSGTQIDVDTPAVRIRIRIL